MANNELRLICTWDEDGYNTDQPPVEMHWSDGRAAVREVFDHIDANTQSGDGPTFGYAVHDVCGNCRKPIVLHASYADCDCDLLDFAPLGEVPDAWDLSDEMWAAVNARAGQQTEAVR